MDAGALLVGLDAEQRQAVTTPVSPLRILAGAGSGKTRVLTRRIAHRVATGDADPRHVLAITFTRKAAGELRERLRALGLRDDVTAGTFHAVAYRLLRARWADLGVREPALLDSKRRLLREIAGVRREVPIADVEAELDWAKARLLTPAAYEEAARANRRRPPGGIARFTAVYARYEQEKQRRRLVDFDDLLWLCAQEIEGDPGYAAAVRWRHRHLFVDEFQDVNPLQWRVLEAWRGTSTDVCVVGDPNQAIYGWNGADPTFLLAFDERMTGCETISLVTSYRSTRQVLATAAAVLGSGASAVGRGAPDVADGPIPSLTEHPDAEGEAAAIARAVRDRRGPGVPWSHQGVLVRTNAQAVAIEAALRAAGIPSRVRHDTRGPAEDPVEVHDDEPSVEPSVDGVDETHRLDPAPAARLAFGAGRVDVATFHAAKGLEWPIVHVAGLEAGLVPIGHARAGPAEAEERRLLYVALTRAGRELHLTWAKSRGGAPRDPSPYLPQIEAVIAGLVDDARPGDWRRHLAAERARLADGAAHERPLLDALRSWRSAAARAADVPAAVIITDQALEAVASSRPTDTDSLLALPGIEPMKAARFGDAVLALVAAHP